MNRIQLLDSHTINKIAAGEVVESPKSVVKELVENAIDAGASSITIEIKDGGISYIRITDNGCGIPKEQLTTAFLRHATNKIQQIEDLENVYSLGFRGEALASIAAVAQVEMVTKVQQEATGSSIEIHGGTVLSVKDTAATVGTSIVVRNIFYNVPARKKFLKKPATESGYISDIVNKFALGHPEISFQFINNQTVMLHTSGNHDRKAAMFHVYGKEAAEKTLPCDYKKGVYSVSGLIGKPELCRSNRSYENLFINGRFIKNALISSAIEEAYKTRLPIGKFPVYVLYFELPPAMVDVNVHPAKLEVRFQQEDEIYEFFYDAVVQALKNEVLIPKTQWQEKPTSKMQEQREQVPPQTIQQILSLFENHSVRDEESDKKEEKEEVLHPYSGRSSVDDLLNQNKSGGAMELQEGRAGGYQISSPVDEIEIEKPYNDDKASVKDRKKDTPSEKPKKSVEPFFNQYKIIGQVFHTYWIVEQKSSIYMIDQHAAHERILYEKLMNDFRQQSVSSQRLLEPIVLQLTPAERETVKDNAELLERFGFGLEYFTEEVVALVSVPFLWKEPSETRFFLDMIDLLQESSVSNVYDTKLLTVATMACKAAVKAHDKLEIQEAEALIKELLKLENPFTCPHGRPTIIEMTQYELEKRFKRVQS
jgi:DNA mismatch repair protein MutL